MLEDGAAEVLDRPGVSLDRALRVRVAAGVEQDAADHAVARDRHEVVHLRAV